MKRHTNCEYRILVHGKEEEDNDKIYGFFKSKDYQDLTIEDVKTGYPIHVIITSAQYCKANGKDAVFFQISTPVTFDMEIIYNLIKACAGDVQISECWYVEKNLENEKIDEGPFTYAYAVDEFKPILETEYKRSYESFGSHLSNKKTYKPIIDVMESKIFILFKRK